MRVDFKLDEESFNLTCLKTDVCLIDPKNGPFTGFLAHQAFYQRIPEVGHTALRGVKYLE